MLVLNTFNFLFLFCDGLCIGVGIFPVQCCKNGWDRLGEYAGVRVYHTREILVVDGFVDLALESCLNEIDICECSTLGVIAFFSGGNLDSGQVSIIWGRWSCWSDIRSVWGSYGSRIILVPCVGASMGGIFSPDRFFYLRMGCDVKKASC